MKHFLVVLFAVFASTSKASDVLEFDDSNFGTEITKYDLILVEFFAPWCGHCKKLAPEYEIAATALKREDPPISLAKVDCTANSDTCSKFGVSGYPTLKIFRGGEFNQDYNGGRSADGIISTLKKMNGPASRVLDDAEKLKKFLENADPVIIGYFEEGNDGIKEFENIASALREDYKFGHTSLADALTEAGTNVVKLHRPKRLKSIFEDQVLTFEGKLNLNNLRNFLKDNIFGLCGHAVSTNFEKFKRPLAVALDANVDYVKNPKGSNYWRNRVMKVGKDFADQMNFAIANPADLGQFLPDSGLPENDKSAKPQKPAVVIYGSDDRKYIMPDLFSLDGFKEFLEKFLNGEISAHIKSAPIPEANDDPVTVVVGKTFDEIVMDESKDVLIEFYAPWCGHCKSLEPKWNELGEKMKDNEDVVIAKMDATANETPKEYAVSGYPTIYWAPKDSKKNPRKYQGGREVADLVKFLKDNASSKIKTEL
ncbi:protein disulfide-isomerase A3-like [Clavelina lepadiformis]|uniref:protein disulfide-isomerase A3-like n=1 Tax=Clavelina lepadiformis TaxID=159417 RepID=UPI004043081E